MMRKSIVVLFCIIVSGFQLEANQEFERTYEIVPGRHIVINNMMGNINVSGYKGKSIKITANSKGPDSEAIQIIDKSFGPRVELFPICKKFKSRNTSVDFDVKVPETVKAVSLQLESGSGKIEVADIDGNIILKSVRGDIKLENAQGNVYARSVSGNVDAKVKEIKNRSRLKFDSGSGNIKVTAPSDIEARVEMTTSGSLTTDFPISKQQGRYGVHVARGKLGTGNQKVDISISSVFGSVSLLKK